MKFFFLFSFSLLPLLVLSFLAFLVFSSLSFPFLLSFPGFVSVLSFPFYSIIFISLFLFSS